MPLTTTLDWGQRYSLLTREYIRDNIRLAASIVIKLDVLARYVEYITRRMYPSLPITDDRTQWKYYLHLAGEYHTTDRPIVTRSADTHEDITLSKSVLSEHTNTRNILRKFGDEYQVLISEYPESVTLITGMLYPADLSTVVSADDGTIVAYNEDMVADNEFSLIEDVESLIKNWIARYYVQGYMLTDDLYAPTMLGVLAAHIPAMLLNTRLKYAYTEEASSFHIDMRFGSRVSYSNTKYPVPVEYKKWANRNMDAIDYMNASNEINELVSSKIRSKLPIKYDHVVRDYINKDGVLYSTYNIGDTSITNEQATTLLKDLDPFSGTVSDAVFSNFTINDEAIYSNNRSIGKTTIINTTEHRGVRPFYNRLHNLVIQWGSHIVNNTLTGVVSINYREPLTLTHSAAYALFWYLYKKVNKLDTIQMPRLYNPWKLRYPKYDISVLEQHVSPEVYTLISSKVPDIYPSGSFVSSELFFNHIDKQYNTTQYIIELIKAAGDNEQLYTYLLFGNLYRPEVISLFNTYIDYNHFFNSTNTTLQWVKDISDSDAVAFMLSILKDVFNIDNTTGYDTETLTDLYKIILPSPFAVNTDNNTPTRYSQQHTINGMVSTNTNNIETFYGNSLTTNGGVPDSGLLYAIDQIKIKDPTKTQLPSIFS